MESRRAISVDVRRQLTRVLYSIYQLILEAQVTNFSASLSVQAIREPSKRKKR